MNLLDLIIKVSLDDRASGGLSRLTEGAITRAGVVSNAIYDVVRSTASAAYEGMSSLVSGAFKGFESYEQMVQGIDKLYGSASQQVQEYAKNAYKTSGLSMNQYMEQSTKFSAALLRGLDGDVDEAARLTEVAMKSMSDNANTFGTNLSSIQLAYQAMSRGEFRTLDNLRLGYSGTKASAKELVKDAAAAKDAQEALGLTVDEESLSFDNLVKAIDVIQYKMNIWGTTSRESVYTVEGSLRTAKASWDNFLTALGTGDPELLDRSVTAMVDSVFGTIKEETGKREGGLLSNVIPVFQRTFESLSEYLAPMAGEMFTNLIGYVNETFGTDLDVGEMISSFTDFRDKVTSLVSEVSQAVSDLWGGFTTTFESDEFSSAFDHVTNVISDLFTFLTDNSETIGTVLGVVASSIGAVADAVASVMDAVGPLIPVIAGAVAAVSGFMAFQGLVGLFTTIGTAISSLTTIVATFGGPIAAVAAALGGWPVLIAAAIGAVVAFIASNEDARELVSNAWNALVEFFSGLPDWWNGVMESLSGFVEGVANGIVGFFTGLKQDFDSMVDQIRQRLDDNKVAWDNFAKNVGDRVTEVVNFVVGLPDAIAGAFADAYNTLTGAGSDIMGGFWDSLQEAWGPVADWVSGLGEWISDHKGPKQYDLGLLVPNGRWIMESLNTGLEMGLPSVERTLSDVTDAIQTGVNANVSVAKVPTQTDAALMGVLGAIRDNMDMKVYLDSGRLVGGIAPQMNVAMGRL